MAQKIEKDLKRFKDIVRGRIKSNLKKFISHGELIGRKGKDKISIPVPHIQLPKFKHGQKEQGGVGSGDGEVGSVYDPNADQQPGDGKAGENTAEHAVEVDVKLDELASILGEELELPRIEPKGKKTIKSVKDKYSSSRRQGPESLRQFKKTYINALKRQISSGTYNPDDPIIVPERSDRRYRSWKETSEPESNAVIGFMMDVSGSMGAEQKELVRLTAFWIEIWLKHQFDNMEIFYIIHDAEAKEVNSEQFYTTRESGGTKISPAYELFMNIVEKRYSPSEWNIYAFHFSDGDNWDGGDDDVSVQILKDRLLPACNLFAYGQCKSAYGSGKFIDTVEANFGKEEKVATSRMDGKEDIIGAIKIFLGKGK